MYKTYGLGALTLSASLAGWASDAHAAPCADLPNPIYVSGSSAVQAYLGKIAVALNSGTGSDKATIVYKSSGSCTGTAALAADTTPTGACTPAGCITGTAKVWGNDAAVTSDCDLDAGGQHIDAILSDVYKESCEGVTGTDALLDTPFVVLPFAFIVNPASSQVAIDAREAYYAYGKGEAGMVTPWTVNANLLQRNAGSGTQVTIFKNTRVPVGAAFGTDATGTSAMITRVSAAAAGAAESTLGFAGTDAIDTKRGAVNILAYRHWDQKKYYYPDSSASSYDKKNVRDGHYTLWGYEHILLRKNASGTALSAAGKLLSDYLTEVKALPGSATVPELETKTALVPTCAMQVSRSTDAGDFSVYKPEASCTCFFEKNVVQGSTSCTACTNNAGCSSSESCNLGYCEAK